MFGNNVVIIIIGEMKLQQVVCYRAGNETLGVALDLEERRKRKNLKLAYLAKASCLEKKWFMGMMI